VKTAIEQTRDHLPGGILPLVYLLIRDESRRGLRVVPVYGHMFGNRSQCPTGRVVSPGSLAVSAAIDNICLCLRE